MPCHIPPRRIVLSKELAVEIFPEIDFLGPFEHHHPGTEYVCPIYVITSTYDGEPLYVIYDFLDESVILTRNNPCAAPKKKDKKDKKDKNQKR